MKRATLTSSPPSPQDHRSLEDIALHPQLRVLRAQPLELLDVAPRQPLGALAGLPGAGHPVAQGPLVAPQVTSHLGDRLPRLLDDPDRSLAELPVVLLARLWHRYPYSRCLHGLGGTSETRTAWWGRR